jgi:hypothetical protein
VDGGQRTVMTGIHCLEHVESFAATAFANDNAIGSHAQRVSHLFPDTHSPLSLHTGQLGLQPNNMILLKL